MHPRPTRPLIAHDPLSLSLSRRRQPLRRLLRRASIQKTLGFPEPPKILNDLPHGARPNARAPGLANPTRDQRSRRIRIGRHRLVRREEPWRALQTLDAHRRGRGRGRRRRRRGFQGRRGCGWAFEERDRSVAVVDVWVRERVVLSRRCGGGIERRGLWSGCGRGR